VEIDIYSRLACSLEVKAEVNVAVSAEAADSNARNRKLQPKPKKEVPMKKRKNGMKFWARLAVVLTIFTVIAKVQIDCTRPYTSL
jgi:hypothetical protein